MPLMLDRRDRLGRNESLVQRVASDAQGALYVVADCTQAVLDNPATAFRVGYEVLDPVDGTWRDGGYVDFVGGPNKGRGGSATKAPGLKVDPAEVAGRDIRVFLTVIGSVRSGVTLDVLSA